jgi:hypothetical protein
MSTEDSIQSPVRSSDLENMKDGSHYAEMTRIKGATINSSKFSTITYIINPGQDQERSKSKSYHHWATPTLMISSFFGAIVFAVAHHLYYEKLNNTLVGSTEKQQWSIRYTSISFHHFSFPNR